MTAYPVLTTTTFLPLVGGALILLFGSERLARWIALATTLATLAVSLPLYWQFDKASSALQFVESADWIPSWNIAYGMGVDGISLPFLFLASLLSVLCIGASWAAVQTRVREFYAALLVAETAMIGLFAASNLFLFFVFWELTLVPIFLLIGVWGGPGRVYAAVKVPMFPVHTWLPNAHTEAPTAGSVILAGILLKMGAYGFLRVSLPILPHGVQLFLKPMLVISAVAIVWGAYVTLVQTDVKRLIAFSSVSHMGFVTLGIFTLNRTGVEGAILQMINHGIISAALFLCVGMIYERTHTREIKDYGGVAKAAPVYSTLLALFCLAAMGTPGLNSFVGEFLIIGAAFKTQAWLGVMAVWGVALGTTYIIWLYYRVVMGEMNPGLVGLKLELNAREVTTLAPLALLALCLGLYPEYVLSYLRVPVAQLLDAGVTP